MRTALFIALIFVAGCRRQPAPTTIAPLPDEPTMTVKTDAEYETLATELMNELLGIFTVAEKDCDKLATDITAYLAKHDERIDAVRAYEDAHDEARKVFEEKMKVREAEVDSALMPSIEACEKHDGFNKAMSAMENF